jgi:hypothetical protein
MRRPFSRYAVDTANDILALHHSSTLDLMIIIIGVIFV